MGKIDLDPPSEKAEEVKTMVSSFSVIIPAYNCEKVVSKTIESIIESIDYFYANCDRPEEVKSEIIAVNDCSTDNTLYFMSQFVGKKYPFKIINHPQGRGAGATRNTGVKNSRGEILFFCDGDDLYLPEHIYVCFTVLNHDPNLSNANDSLKIGDLKIKMQEDRLDGIRTGVKIKDRIDPNWKLGIENSLTINLCLRRECHEFIEGYPEDLVYKQIGGREDCAYHKYLSRFFKIGKISIETVEYIRYSGNSLDRQIVRAETAEGMPEEEKVLHDRATKLEQEKIAYLREKYNKRYPQSQKSDFKREYEAHCQLKGYQFTQDWFSINIPLWQQVLQQFANRPGLKFLEIGSWEGRSTCWLLDNILTQESSRITCIDTFEGSVEHQGYEEGYIKSIEGIFDFNIARTGAAERVEKLIGISQNVLRTLPMHSYDVIYIDGSHLATDVLEDTLLSWRLAKVKGLIVFDDYNLTLFKNPTQNAKLGIDAFLTVFHEKVKVLHKGYQVVVEKIAS